MSQTVNTTVAFNSGTGILPVRSSSHGQDARATKDVRATKAALKICIIGLKCYDHIAEKPVPQYLGGIETQMAVLAKGLRSEGCEVSLITFDPDGIVGRVVTTVEEFIAQLRALPNSEAYAGMSRVAKKFFAENYSVETISRRFRQAFEEIVAS
jgi:hypothetical protein